MVLPTKTEALKDYHKHRAHIRSPVFQAIPDGHVVNARRRACKKCTYFQDETPPLCTGCKNCKGRPRKITWMTPLWFFSCPKGLWKK